MNGNSATAPTSTSTDPWADYLAGKGKSKGGNCKGQSREDRARWEEDGIKEDSQLIDKQFTCEGSPVPQIAASKVQHEATGAAFCTLKTLHVLAKVRYEKALALVIPGSHSHGPVFDALGFTASCMRTQVIQVHIPSETKLNCEG